MKDEINFKKNNILDDENIINQINHEENQEQIYKNEKK